MRNFRSFLLLAGGLLLTGMVQAQVLTTTPTTAVPVVPTAQVVITSPVPAPQEIIAVPAGYTNCYTVAAGYYNNVWVSEREVCQYTGNALGTTWVSGYWQCTEYNNSGVCTAWDWVTGHWSDQTYY